MEDMSFLTNLAQVASGFATATATLIGLYWKFVISPNKKFKNDVMSSLKRLEERLGIVEKDQINLEDDSKADNTQLEAKVMREIEDLRQDQQTLTQSVNKHVDEINRKNEKLLDIIIRYFTEK